ncbi:MAG: tetratricopeptide repeat protein, partial [Acidobacteriota bacterium]
GQILQGLGRLDEAAAQYKEALKHDPGSAEAQNNLGVALAGLGRIEEAATHFREALRLKPDHASARANLTRALALLKKENRPVGL